MSAEVLDTTAILKGLAKRLRMGRPLWFVLPVHNGLADAIYWWDERPWRLTLDEQLVLYTLFHIRTMRMIGRADAPEVMEHAPLWIDAQAIMPKWVGFAPSRLAGTAWLLAFYRSARDEFDKNVITPLAATLDTDCELTEPVESPAR